jgi:hypothetical protein
MKSDGFPVPLLPRSASCSRLLCRYSRPQRSVASCPEPRANHDLGASTVAAHSIKQTARSPIAR